MIDNCPVEFVRDFILLFSYLGNRFVYNFYYKRRRFISFSLSFNDEVQFAMYLGFFIAVEKYAAYTDVYESKQTWSRKLRTDSFATTIMITKTSTLTHTHAGIWQWFSLAYSITQVLFGGYNLYVNIRNRNQTRFLCIVANWNLIFKNDLLKHK